MTRLGGQWSEADQQELLGSSLDNAVRYFLARAAVPADPAEVAEWIMGGIVDQVRERGVTVMPGAAGLVAEVAAAGLPYALVTSSQRRFVDAVLARTGLRFPVVVCGSDVTRGKPDPEPYLLAARRLGVPPARCLALEDSITGVTRGRGRRLRRGRGAHAAAHRATSRPPGAAVAARRQPRPAAVRLGGRRRRGGRPADRALPGLSRRSSRPTVPRRPPPARAAGSGTRPGDPSR